MYYVIRGTTVVEMTKEELLENIAEEYWGDVRFMSEITGSDTNYWGNDMVIIKGEVVIPEPVETVTSYDII